MTTSAQKTEEIQNHFKNFGIDVPRSQVSNALELVGGNVEQAKQYL